MSPSRTATIAVIWSAAVASVLGVARVTKVGPILLSVSRHGVHLGDMAAFGLAVGLAALVTATLIRRQGAPAA